MMAEHEGHGQDQEHLGRDASVCTSLSLYIYIYMCTCPYIYLYLSLSLYIYAIYILHIYIYIYILLSASYSWPREGDFLFQVCVEGTRQAPQMNRRGVDTGRPACGDKVPSGPSKGD